MANTIEGRPDDSYTVDTGDADCPDHMWLFSEGSGTAIADEGSGTAADLTLSNALAWATDTGINVVDLAGSYTATSDNAAGLSDFPCTISCLVSWTASHNGHPMNVANASDGDRFGFITTVTSGYYRAQYYGSEETESATTDSGADYSDGTWRWWTIRLVSDTSKVFYRGTTSVNTNTTSHSVTSALDEVHFGSRTSGSGSNPYNGKIAMAMLWNSDLGAAGVSRVFADPSGAGFSFINYSGGGLGGIRNVAGYQPGVIFNGSS